MHVLMGGHSAPSPVWKTGVEGHTKGPQISAYTSGGESTSCDILYSCAWCHFRCLVEGARTSGPPHTLPPPQGPRGLQTLYTAVRSPSRPRSVLVYCRAWPEHMALSPSPPPGKRPCAEGAPSGLPRKCEHALTDCAAPSFPHSFCIGFHADTCRCCCYAHPSATPPGDAPA